MTIVKRPTQLGAYASVLPYASELSGVYQPLLGWKSGQIEDRFREGFSAIVRFDRAAQTAFRRARGARSAENGQITIEISPGMAKDGKLRTFDSVLHERDKISVPSLPKSICVHLAGRAVARWSQRLYGAESGVRLCVVHVLPAPLPRRSATMVAGGSSCHGSDRGIARTHRRSRASTHSLSGGYAVAAAQRHGQGSPLS